MAVSDPQVFPCFLTPVLTQLFFPKPPTTFLICFCRCERLERKFTSTGDRTLNHQIMSPTFLSHLGRAAIYLVIKQLQQEGCTLSVSEAMHVFPCFFTQGSMSTNHSQPLTTQSQLSTTLKKNLFKNIVGNQHFLFSPQCFLPYQR